MFWQLSYLERKHTNAQMLEVVGMIMMTGIQLLIFKSWHSGRGDNGCLFSAIILKKDLVRNSITLLVCVKQGCCKHDRSVSLTHWEMTVIFQIFLLLTAWLYFAVFSSLHAVLLRIYAYISDGSFSCNEMARAIWVIVWLDVWINRKCIACAHTLLNNSVTNVAIGTLVCAPYKGSEEQHCACICLVLRVREWCTMQLEKYHCHCIHCV